jgi:hypothetical protein
MQILVINVNIVVVANTLDRENDLTNLWILLYNQINILIKYNIIYWIKIIG